MDKYTDLLSKKSENCKEFSPYIPLSEYNIFNVLEINAKEVIMCRFLADLPIKSIVMQYIDVIHIIADEREQKAMEKSLEALYESPEYFSAGIEVEKAMKTAKLNLIRLVFDDFKEEMKTVASKYGLELEKDANYYVYDDECNEKFYDGSSTSYPGLNYIVTNAKFREKNIQMWFRIEVPDTLYAGMTIFDTSAKPEDAFSKGYEVDEITEQMKEQIAQYLDRDIITPIGWWVTWCYPNGKRQDAYYDDVPDFKHMNQCAISLVDHKKRKEFVKNAVKTFENHILKYLLNI